MNKLDILITGVGGQGNILASDIVAEAALTAGYDVKKTDTLGMAQRGGSVVSHVRLGGTVCSPLIPRGEADILLAFERLEAARWCHYLRPDAVAVVNNHALPPLSVNLGNDRYPSEDEVGRIIRRHAGRVFFVNGTSRASELGNPRTLNIFMLGCLAPFMPFDTETWKEQVRRRLPPALHPVNLAAFDLGQKEIHDVHV